MSIETPSGWETGPVHTQRSTTPRTALTRACVPLALLLCGLLSEAALGSERVTLENGRSIVGTVLRETPTRVRVRTSRGEFWLDKKDIASIEAAEDASEKKPTTRAATIRKTPLERPPREAASTPASSGATAAAKDILRDMGSPRPSVRRAAAYRMVRSWPDSSTALETVLDHGSDEARTEAARLLSRPDVGSDRENAKLVRRRLRDPLAAVRRLALRAVGARGHTSLESEALRLLDEDPDAAVRLEAARTVARVGSERTASNVVAVWSNESRAGRQRLYHGVLVVLFGEDLGPEPAKWWTAIDEVFAGERLLNDPARRLSLDTVMRRISR